MQKNDHKHYNQLKDHCKEIGIKVRQVKSSRLLDFAAMNPAAAADMHYKRIKKNEIIIDKKLPLHAKVRDLRHELIEMDRMSRGCHKGQYWPAHVYATKNEKHKTKWEK